MLRLQLHYTTCSEHEGSCSFKLRSCALEYFVLDIELDIIEFDSA